MRTIIILILFLLPNIAGYGQGLIDEYPGIKEEKEQIDQNDSLKILTLENEDFMDKITDGGGVLKGHFDKKGKIRKIEMTVYESTGIRYFDYYLNEEDPFLIQEEFRRFYYDEKSNSLDPTRFDGGFNGAYLFRENKLIDWISLGHNRFENDKIVIERTFQTELEEYIRIIKKRLSN